ncbi:MAG: fructoselysine 6-kinase [Acetatifactor sp.]|nr:fructoselysine 6-kinase [Acetatifactor sp.]
MKLAAVGDNCMDVYDNIGQEFAGGGPVNMAVYFVRLGGEASYTGAVGNDTYGEFMKEQIVKKGVDISHLHVLNGNTAVTHVELKNGERILGEYDEGVLSDFRLSEEDKRFLLTHDMLTTSLWGNVHGDLKELHDRGMKIAFDAATRPEDDVAVIAAAASDYFFFSSDEADTKELRETMKKIWNRGPKMVIATLGEQGSVAFDGKAYTTFGIVPCEVEDTMGAGDSYIAGFLKGILEEKPMEECMKMGAYNSSITLGYKGAW